ncbi:tRNA lysidine(34) synthetase TilS [uncultured Tolumonas sp.]|uniref:tRNA lysidine(34) synthetase TilS n=1 Tax=uncultured Tolumonas sp. TaxID=263765 RepID=UPI00292E83C4|nr:tRNA lysidine(34) synthetase TilS [uncultured Tolumonas sp.]
MSHYRVETDVFAILDQQLKPGPLLVGFSGGLDSRVLLELLARYTRQRTGFSLQAVHVHHGLNPLADQWLSHCQQTCQTLAIPFTAQRVEIAKQNRQSLEDLARQARYAVFRQYLPIGGMLLTAHHQDDQLETLLLALKRGSGPRGLAAMPMETDFAGGRLVRPLLSFSRQQLLDWAISQRLSWIEDDSNHDERFDRNFLRQRVIPLLRERWPEMAVTAARSAALCAEQETLLDEIAKTDLFACQHVDGSLQIELLESLSPARRHQLLRFWLRQQTGTVPSHAQLQKIWPEVALARADAMPELVWQQGVIRRYQQRLYHVSPMPAAMLSQALPIDIPVHLANGVLTLQTDYLNEMRLRMPEAEEQITLEYGLPGSHKAHPVGREHSRELKKLWQEYEVAPWRRGTMPVICYQGKIAAVVGLFICQDYLCETGCKGLTINWQPNA